MDDSGKFVKLFWILFFTVIGFVISLLLLFLLMRLFFGLLGYLPWMVYVYTIFILTVPTAIFLSAFIIFLRRTKSHVSKIARFVSYTVFLVFILLWITAFGFDVKTFITKARTEIEFYYTWNMIFLASSVACLFLIGVLQALTAKKEEDWLDKYNQI